MTEATGLGRLPPTDYEHEYKYPLRLVMPRTVATVERLLPLPAQYRDNYDQGREGACVGFSCSWAMSILNRRFYHAQWLYEEARRRDEWPGENYDGTSVRAGLDVLRDTGHRRIFRGQTKDTNYADGINEFRWANSVDEIRTAIAAGAPVVLGIDWFYDFYQPIQNGREWWLPATSGGIAGGHAICCYGASDRRQAVKLVNSWGNTYPTVWLSYANLERLLAGFDYPGEAAVITDRN
jgi:hypothetical protein